MNEWNLIDKNKIDFVLEKKANFIYTILRNRNGIKCERA